mmetsp:Transcript_17110/g.42021  ORF Transcript_17110/g.42021 Transcript_17110/m.42021 type:complete len:276 (-) Transcript_17110:129-956(-)
MEKRERRVVREGRVRVGQQRRQRGAARRVARAARRHAHGAHRRQLRRAGARHAFHGAHAALRHAAAVALPHHMDGGGRRRHERRRRRRFRRRSVRHRRRVLAQRREPCETLFGRPRSRAAASVERHVLVRQLARRRRRRAAPPRVRVVGARRGRRARARHHHARARHDGLHGPSHVELRADRHTAAAVLRAAHQRHGSCGADCRPASNTTRSSQQVAGGSDGVRQLGGLLLRRFRRFLGRVALLLHNDDAVLDAREAASGRSQVVRDRSADSSDA